MKKIYLVIIIALFLFSFCGGLKPKTEPAQPTPAKKSTEESQPQPPPSPPSQPDSETQKSQQDESPVITTSTTEEEKPKRTPITAEDGRKYHPHLIEVKPLQNENLPIIEPKQKSISTPDNAHLKEIMILLEGINSGITKIFREFGYSGNIDVPESFKKRVAYYIHYFIHNPVGSEFYLRGISRGSEYLPMIKRILKEKHLPLSLAYLPFIESGYSPVARSRAGAVGMWQFMRGTARMYGLKVSRHHDDRKDPIKSTYAAAEYLNDLLAMFGAEDPFLGICAFNAGENKILSALRKISYTERSFWTLVKKNLLRNETNEYIPQFLAVILMASHPEKYAAIPKEMPLEPQKAKAKEEKNQQFISSLHHSDSKDNLGEENQQPLNTTDEKSSKKTPPDSTNTNTSKSMSASHQIYKVNPGDTLYSIARRHNVKVDTLKNWNDLHSNNIYPGQKLKVYSPGSSKAKNSSKGYKLIYTVNYKDSLARIALFFKGVSARDIMKWNRLKRSRIYPKQKLVLYIDHSPRQVLTHTVKKGESAFKIAMKYKTRVEYVLALNGLLSDTPLQPGQKLKIYRF